MDLIGSDVAKSKTEPQLWQTDGVRFHKALWVSLPPSVSCDDLNGSTWHSRQTSSPHCCSTLFYMAQSSYCYSAPLCLTPLTDTIGCQVGKKETAMLKRQINKQIKYHRRAWKNVYKSSVFCVKVHMQLGELPLRKVPCLLLSKRSWWEIIESTGLNLVQERLNDGETVGRSVPRPGERVQPGALQQHPQRWNLPHSLNFHILQSSFPTKLPPTGWWKVVFLSLCFCFLYLKWYDQIARVLVDLKLPNCSEKTRFNLVLPRQETKVWLCVVTSGQRILSWICDTAPHIAVCSQLPPFLFSIKVEAESKKKANTGWCHAK